MTCRKTICRFIDNESGQGTVEYVAIIGLISIVAIVSLIAIGNDVRTRLNSFPFSPTA